MALAELGQVTKVCNGAAAPVRALGGVGLSIEGGECVKNVMLPLAAARIERTKQRDLAIDALDRVSHLQAGGLTIFMVAHDAAMASRANRIVTSRMAC